MRGWQRVKTYQTFLIAYTVLDDIHRPVNDFGCVDTYMAKNKN